MDTLAVLKLTISLLPRVPLICRIVLYHALGLCETQQDLRTELTVSIIRSFIVVPTHDSVSKTQEDSIKDPGIKGKIWVSKVVIPSADESVRKALFRVIEVLKEPGAEPGGYMEPKLAPVEAEWTGYRARAIKSSHELQSSETQKYIQLMKEATSPTTILYFHGGAYYLLDPATHRSMTAKLAQLTKGRCFSVRYRLSPQNPFPAALLDALVAYFSLIYPTPDSFHEPVQPKHIVFSGESAGGNMSIALLQTLLELRRQKIKIHWNGEDRDVPLPAGVAVLSPWMDITHCMPSCEINAKYDFLPAQALQPIRMQYPPCPIWPADPPRRSIYAEDAILCHPLVSPIGAKGTIWEASCPLWIATGWELLTDEARHVAMKAARQGVKVVYAEFEAMPHVFAMVMVGTEVSKRCFDLWSGFITAAVENPESIETRGLSFKPKTLDAREVDVLTLSPYAEEEVSAMMRGAIADMGP